jgi:Ras-related GTP-binding protein C/D
LNIDINNNPHIQF